MPCQCKNCLGQVFLKCFDGINFCLFLYCDDTVVNKHYDSVVYRNKHDDSVIK